MLFIEADDRLCPSRWVIGKAAHLTPKESSASFGNIQGKGVIDTNESILDKLVELGVGVGVMMVVRHRIALRFTASLAEIQSAASFANRDHAW